MQNRISAKNLNDLTSIISLFYGNYTKHVITSVKSFCYKHLTHNKDCLPLLTYILFSVFNVKGNKKPILKMRIGIKMYSYHKKLVARSLLLH